MSEAYGLFETASSAAYLASEKDRERTPYETPYDQMCAVCHGAEFYLTARAFGSVTENMYKGWGTTYAGGVRVV